MKLETTARSARPRLLGLAKRLFGDRPSVDAEDLVQDVFASLIANPGLVETVTDLTAYLYRALRNRITDRHRAPEGAVSLDHETDDGGTAKDRVDDGRPLPPDLLAEQEMFTALDAALLSLSDEDRELVTRVELGGETHDDLARERGVPLGTILSQKNRALRRLKDELSAMGMNSPFGEPP